MPTCLNIPILGVPNQTFKVRLNNRDCNLKLYIRGADLYLDLYIGDNPIRVGNRIEVNKPILIDVPEYQFTGNFYIIDTRRRGPAKPPIVDELGERWKLAYIYD